MITEAEKDIITRCAAKYNVSSVILFGSSLRVEREANDIDLGVEGIDPRQFFKFYAELYKQLSKPVDLINLKRKTKFNELIMEAGVRIYG